jgi:hypothetical protein
MGNNLQKDNLLGMSCSSWVSSPWQDADRICTLSISECIDQLFSNGIGDDIGDVFVILGQTCYITPVLVYVYYYCMALSYDARLLNYYLCRISGTTVYLLQSLLNDYHPLSLTSNHTLSTYHTLVSITIYHYQ